MMENNDNSKASNGSSPLAEDTKKTSGSSPLDDNSKTPSDSVEQASGLKGRGYKDRLGRFFSLALEYVKHARVELLIILTAVVLDLVSKYIVDALMPINSRETLISNFLYFYYVHNRKAAFGSAFGLDELLGSKGVMTFFIIFTSISICLFFYFMYLFRNRRKLVRYSLAMIIGGAIGNFYDRVVFGYVRDFIEIEYLGYDVPLLGRSFAIFNIADSFLTIGMILLIFYLVFIYTREESKKEKEKESKENNKSPNEDTKDNPKEDKQDNVQENATQQDTKNNPQQAAQNATQHDTKNNPQQDTQNDVRDIIGEK